MGCALMKTSLGEALVVAAGGEQNNWATKSDKVEIYKISKNQWEDGESLPSPERWDV